MLGMVQDEVTERFKGLDTEPDTYLRCLYSNNLEDGEFIVGSHPDNRDVFVAAGFTGEGFKFGTFIGELLASMVVGDKPTIPQAALEFRPDRLSLADPDCDLKNRCRGP
mmetsp:Transcript_21995/g.52329  ORF Transcript_21995/g.52329 Transcript_21995/m.52329 type:complete len:109 (+) Transcript_21995:159-485(+)